MTYRYTKKGPVNNKTRPIIPDDRSEVDHHVKKLRKAISQTSEAIKELQARVDATEQAIRQIRKNNKETNTNGKGIRTPDPGS